MAEKVSDTSSRWIINIDTRDVIGFIGACTAIAGASLIHWGAGILLTGGALFAFALRMSR